jgi:hypothetical protein
VVHGVVPYLAWYSAGAGELRELGEEVVHGCYAAYGFYARDRHLCGSGLSRQRCGTVEESVVPAVDKETEVGQYVYADDGCLDVGHHETPGETAA